MLNREEREYIARVYGRATAKGKFGPKTKALIDQASELDPDFVGSLRQTFADERAAANPVSPAVSLPDEQAGVLAPGDQPNFLELFGLPIVPNLPSFTAIAREGLKSDAVKAAVSANDAFNPASPLIGALSAFDAGVPLEQIPTAMESPALTMDALKQLAGQAEPAPLIDPNDSRILETLSYSPQFLPSRITQAITGATPEEQIARELKFAPGVGAAGAAFDAPMPLPLEIVAGFTRNAPALGLAAAGSAAAAPALVGGAAADAFAQQGDATDVAANAAFAAAGMQLGAALPSRTAGQIVGSEAAQLGLVPLQAFVQEPGTVARLTEGTADQMDMDILSGVAAQAFGQAAVSGATGALQARANRNRVLENAGASQAAFEQQQTLSRAGTEELASLPPELRAEVEARAQDIERQAATGMTNTFARTPAEARAFATAQAQKRAATGDDTATLTRDEYNEAVLRSGAGEEELYTPPGIASRTASKVGDLGSALYNASGAVFRALAGGVRDVNIKGPEPPPAADSFRVLRAQGMDPALAAMGDDYIRRAEAVRATNPDEAIRLETAGLEMKRQASRPINVQPVTKNQLADILEASADDLDERALADAGFAEGFAQFQDEATARGGRTLGEAEAKIDKREGIIEERTAKATRLADLSEEARKQVRLITDEFNALAKRAVGLKEGRTPEESEKIRAGLDSLRTRMEEVLSAEGLSGMADTGTKQGARTLLEQVDILGQNASLILDRNAEIESELSDVRQRLSRMRARGAGAEDTFKEITGRKVAAERKRREAIAENKQLRVELESLKGKRDADSRARRRAAKQKLKSNRIASREARSDVQAAREAINRLSPRQRVDIREYEDLTQRRAALESARGATRDELDAMLEGFARDERAAGREVLAESEPALTKLVRRLGEDAEKRQKQGEVERSRTVQRDVFGKMMTSLRDASDTDRARFLDSAVLSQDIRQRLSGATPEGLTSARQGIDTQLTDLSTKRLEALGREKEIQKRLKETTSRRRTLSGESRRTAKDARDLTKAGSPDAQAADEASKALEASVGAVDAELDTVRGELAATQREILNLTREEQMLRQERAGLTALPMDDPDYPQRRAEVLNQLVDEGSFNTIAQADNFIRTMEENEARGEVSRYFDYLSRNDAARDAVDEMRAGLKVFADAGTDPAVTDDLAVTLAMKRELSRRQDLIRTTIDAALRGVSVRDSVFAKAVDSAASGLSLAVRGFNWTGNRAAILANAINDSENPNRVQVALAADILQRTANKAENIALALRTAMDIRLNPQLDGTVKGFVKRQVEEAKRQLTIPHYNAKEREILESPTFGLRALLESGDRDTLVQKLEAAGIKNAENSRIVKMFDSAREITTSVRPAAAAVGIPLRDEYFPRNIHQDIIALLQSDRGESIAQRIAEQKKQEVLAKTGDPDAAEAEFQRTFRGLMGAIVEPGGRFSASEEANSIREMIGARFQARKFTMQQLADAAPAKARELDLPEFIFEDDGKPLAVLSRDFEGTLYNYADQIGRVIAARSEFGYTPDGKPQRMVDLLATIPEDTTEFNALASLFDQMSTGVGDWSFTEGGPKLAYTVERKYPKVNAALRSADALMTTAKSLMVAGSHMNQLLSFIPIFRNARGWRAKLAAVDPSFGWLTDKMVKSELARLHKENALANFGLAKLVADGDDNAMRQLRVLYIGLANDIAQALEAIEGERTIETEGGVRRGARVSANAVSTLTGITAMNRGISAKSADVAALTLAHLVTDLKHPKITIRRAARHDLRTLLGVNDFDRLAKEGITEQDIMTAGRSSRARYNAVDRTAWEQPEILRHPFARKAFALQAIAMIQASNFAMDVERARALGVLQQPLTRGVQGELGGKAAAAFVALLIGGFYKDLQNSFRKREPITESPFADIALRSASEAGWMPAIPENIAYGVKYGSSPEEMAFELMGGFPAQIYTGQTLFELGRYAGSGFEDSEQLVKMTPPARLIAEGTAGLYGPDNIKKRIREYERATKSLSNADFVRLLEDAEILSDVVSRGRRAKLLRKLHGPIVPEDNEDEAQP